MDKSPALKAVAGVEVPVTVKLAETKMTLEEILALRPGATLTFVQGVRSPIQLEVDGATVAEGHAVERHGEVGFRIERLTGRHPSPPAVG